MIGANINKPIEVPVTMRSISKTVKTDDGSIVKGIDVETHCKIVGLVAKELLSYYPEWILKKHFPPGSDLIAACHDVGKISPDFQLMIHKSLTSWVKDEYPELAYANAERAKRKENSFHAKVSQSSLTEILDDNDQFIPEIVGKHHGFKPNSSIRTENAFGGSIWSEQRHLLIQKLLVYFLGENNKWPSISSFKQSNVIAGLVTVADWIGSGGVFSKLLFENSTNDFELEKLAQSAVSEAGFHKHVIKKGLSFREIFGFTSLPVQEKFVHTITGPGVYILEAPMGLGKTEAALYAAYSLLSQNITTGIYFALPTQLTSNKIHERVNSFLLKISDSPEVSLHAKLLHSAAWLTQTVFGEDADTGGSWFDSTKRGIIAPFAVGTIDQALMAVMNVTHGFVRTFGLAGKVVILDEVHSYDSFTGTIMNDLISCLKDIGCTVIILSATLTANQKMNILKLSFDSVLSAEYPLITAMPCAASSISEISVNADKNSVVEILHGNNDRAVIDIVIEKAEQGEQVLWIENAVADAQSIFQLISTRIDKSLVECGLIHSRFTKSERQVNEDYWVSLYGKDGITKRYEKGRILIGTQVLEQSVDIDSDFLVTRLCPTDMLLQRIGRLWRHSLFDNIRPSNSGCKVYILAPSYDDAIIKHDQFGKSANVYSEYVLCRTLEIWENLQNVILPVDIRSLLERTYKEREETGKLQKLKTELGRIREKLHQQALMGLSTEINTLPETKAQTRYSEMETIDVLLIKSLKMTGKDHTLKFINNSELLVPYLCTNAKQKREIASIILQNTVRVSDYLAPAADTDLSWLKQYVFVGGAEYDDNPFRIVCVGLDDEIKSIIGSNANEKYTLWYNSNIGYKAEKKGGNN